MKIESMDQNSARYAYRSAWNHFLMSPPGAMRNTLDDLMVLLKDRCGDWDQFCRTLPSYQSYMRRIKEDSAGISK